MSTAVELGQHLASIKADVISESDVGCPTIDDPKGADAPWRMALILLHRLAAATPVVVAIGRFLELPQSQSLRDMTMREPSAFRQAIDYEVDEQLLVTVANQLGSRPCDAHNRIVRFSCDSRLLPPSIVDIVGTHVPGADRRPCGVWYRS
jgi:hypothetical protein